MTDINEEIRRALDGRGGEYIAFEEIQNEGESPLNQPVVNSDNDSEKPETEGRQPDPKERQTGQDDDDKPDDAPEQVIDQDYDEDAAEKDETGFEIPTGHAGQAADALMGITDNVLEVGGGYFVKIRKHDEFYEFEEVIRIIEK
ncbi:MAG: hypothetical protein KDD04_02615, partial [Sinomicrobium sp.]|nr:hypothetical protein [Sinomicrobium sp.]